MRILMLGNSFTYYNDMPKILSAMLDAEVVAITRGGAYLAAHVDPEDELYHQTHKALEEKWDYVVLQDQSIGPVAKRESFQHCASELCALIHQAGAKPVFYATWAYREGSEKLVNTGLSHQEMLQGLYESYHAAAENGGALAADVGVAFDKVRSIVDLYMEDDFHPSAAGSVLAAATIAETIRKDCK